jgi:hypothetical protein
MSVLITGSVGLVPVSSFIAGAAVEVSLEATMLIGGGAMALLALGSLLSRPVRNLGLEQLQGAAPTGDSVDAPVGAPETGAAESGA